MNREGFVKAAVFAAGVNYLITGLGLLFASEWFFTNIGYFPPFNRHYAGDLGAFTLPLGLALLWVWRSPRQHQSLLGFAAAASLIHALNHAYDDFVVGGIGGIPQTLPLLAFALLVLAAWWQARRIQ